MPRKDRADTLHSSSGRGAQSSLEPGTPADDLDRTFKFPASPQTTALPDTERSKASILHQKQTEAIDYFSIPKPTLSSAPVPQESSIISQADALPPIPRFTYLLQHVTSLVRMRGPYRINEVGQLICRPRPQPVLSDTRFAVSLAAAQDASNQTLHPPQPEGPVFDDLKVFYMLWNTTTFILEEILGGEMDRIDQGMRTWGTLGIEAFGWGAWGLSAGYTDAGNDELFRSHRERLYVALTALLQLKKVPGSESGNAKVKVGGREHTVPTANRSAHVCATMLLQSMRRDWARVRWGHSILVCRRWMGNLGLLAEEGLMFEMQGSPEAQEIAVIETAIDDKESGEADDQGEGLQMSSVNMKTTPRPRRLSSR